MELNNEKMKQIDGGAITSAMINALSKAVNTLYELGKATGSALRRIIKKSYCKGRVYMKEKKGYKVLVSFAEGDAQAQISGIRDMMQEECEALIIHPADPYSLTEVLAEAKSQGITIVSYEDLIMETADISYYVAFNARMTGQLVGNAIVKEKELEKARKNQTSCDIEFFYGFSG